MIVSKSLVLSEISDFIGQVNGTLLYPRNRTPEARSFMEIAAKPPFRCPDPLCQFLAVISSRVFLSGNKALVDGITVGNNLIPGSDYIRAAGGVTAETTPVPLHDLCRVRPSPGGSPWQARTQGSLGIHPSDGPGRKLLSQSAPACFKNGSAGRSGRRRPCAGRTRPCVRSRRPWQTRILLCLFGRAA